ncbi:hypothetical protein [Mesorhizobium sp. M2A.F.Ca.ET.042.01.1.1]|uniref:hypothetical protein n=1 Tax=Mesorhizobium sp. M2A.F.Ca.ET.042.01.1.1 TaxID=2496745 RepID=UPI00167B0AFD|nr:hypothetical protein [Mesorhizobium sp. M2A.F.Ca.ET.042.01.1.1]
MKAVSTETARLSFIGRLVPPSFAEFCDRRAEKLDLKMAIRSVAADRFTVEVSGQPDLVDAFEMACSLGPLDCLVLDYERTRIHSIANGEQER